MLTFLAGDRERPRGHALLVFHDADTPGGVWATYLVVTPIAMDLSKYVPAAFMGPQMGAALAPTGPTAYPLPPMPERIEGGLNTLERLASLRGDDLLDGGTVRLTDPWQAMQPVADIGHQYAEAYEAYAAHAEPTTLARESPAALASTTNASVEVDNLLLQVMPDSEKIGRLARLTGTLRYAVDGGDAALVTETVDEMQRIAKHLPEKYRAADLIDAAQSSARPSSELAQAYVERCYRLADEDYAALAALDDRIAALRAEAGLGQP